MPITSFEPRITADTPPTSVNYGSRHGYWVKLGQLVFIGARVTVSSATGGNGALSLVLPDVPQTGPSYQPLANSYTSLSLASERWNAVLVNSNTRLVNWLPGNGVAGRMPLSRVASGGTLAVSGIYLTHP